MRRASTAVGALLARATAATHDPARHLSRASLPVSSILVTNANTTTTTPPAAFPAPRRRWSSSPASAAARHQLVTVELISDTM